METLRFNQRLGFIIEKIMALSADKRQACLSEIQKKIEPEQWEMVRKTLSQQQKINLQMQHPLKMPLGNMQRLMWNMEIASGYSKNEVTSMYFEGTLNIEKLEEAISSAIQKYDIFHFRAKKYLPLAQKKPIQKVEFLHFTLDPKRSMEEQLEHINTQLAQINFRSTGNDLCACLVRIDKNLVLLHLVINHKMIDARTKVLLWQSIWQAYHDKEGAKPAPFRDYIHKESKYYANLYRDLQQHVKHAYSSLSPCEILEPIIDKKTIIKKRHMLMLEPNLLEKLKTFALEHDFTLDELIMGAFIAALKPFCLNNGFFVQLISQPHFSQQQDVFGPSLNERFFAAEITGNGMRDIVSVVKEKNRESLNYSNLPYGAGLGWVYHAKYKKSAAIISFFLYHLLRISRYAKVDKSIADCYAGLIAYEFLANKKCVLPLLSFNFRQAFTEKPLSEYDDKLIAKSYTFPLYRNTENYFSINVDSSEAGLSIHVESHLQEYIDQKITETCLQNLQNLLGK